MTLGRQEGRRTENLMTLSISAAQITPKSTLMTIYLSSPLNFGETAGDPWTAGGAADLKSNDIIKFSGLNNLIIDTHNHISAISFEFWCGGGRRVTLDSGRGGGPKI